MCLVCYQNINFLIIDQNLMFVWMVIKRLASQCFTANFNLTFWEDNFGLKPNNSDSQKVQKTRVTSRSRIKDSSNGTCRPNTHQNTPTKTHPAAACIPRHHPRPWTVVLTSDRRWIN